MKRRNFLKSLLPVGLFAGGFIPLNAFSETIPNSIILKSGSPSNRFKRGIKELGGITRFVKKGDRVVIKPTMAYDKSPDFGYNSDPDLIKEIISQCVEADVKVVSIFDQTYEIWTKCYKNSGIERIAKDAYARVLPANDERFYSEIEIGNTGILNSIKIHNSILAADVIINVAAARIDSNNQFFGGIKNLAGCVWNRNLFENVKYEEQWIELTDQINPTLSIVDSKELQVISTNCIATDILALQTMKYDVESCSYLKKVSTDKMNKLTSTIKETKTIKV